MSTLCPASSSLLSTLDRFDCLHAKEKQSLLHSECGCTGRWTRLKPKMTVGKLWRWIQNVCVFIVYAIRCEWFPRKTLFLPVYIGSLFQFWLQRISNQHVFSTAFFFVLVFWVIIFSPNAVLKPYFYLHVIVVFVCWRGQDELWEWLPVIFINRWLYTVLSFWCEFIFNSYGLSSTHTQY